MSRRLTVSTLLDAGSSVISMSCMGDGIKLASFGIEDPKSTKVRLSEADFVCATLGFLLAGGLIERFEALCSGNLDAFLFPLSSLGRLRG